MFNDIRILHRTVDKMPWADPGTTEQEVGEHLLILVPVQSCLTALKWKAQGASKSASQVYMYRFSQYLSSSLTYHGHVVVDVFHPLPHVVFHAQEADKEVLQLLLADDAVAVAVDQVEEDIWDGPDPVGKVSEATGVVAEPAPHVEPRGEADRGAGVPVGGQGPSRVLPRPRLVVLHPLQVVLLNEGLPEHVEHVVDPVVGGGIHLVPGIFLLFMRSENGSLRHLISV